MVPPRPVDFGVCRRMPRIARTPITTWATVRAVFTQQRLLGNASGPSIGASARSAPARRRFKSGAAACRRAPIATLCCGTVSTKCLCRICRSGPPGAARSPLLRRRCWSSAARRSRRRRCARPAPAPLLGPAAPVMVGADRVTAAAQWRGHVCAPRVADQRRAPEHPRRDLRVRPARPRRRAHRRGAAWGGSHGHRRPVGIEQRRHRGAAAYRRH